MKSKIDIYIGVFFKIITSLTVSSFVVIDTVYFSSLGGAVGSSISTVPFAAVITLVSKQQQRIQ